MVLDQASDSLQAQDSYDAVSVDSDSDASRSDSLDSIASRKRRRVSPPTKDTNAPPLSSVVVPSRAKARATERTLQKPIAVEAQATFESINVKPWLVASLKVMKIDRPTAIQKACIPEILKGRDCIGGSRTGSGKTVAFAVPILQKWAEDPRGIFALILTPTRYVLALFQRMSGFMLIQALENWHVRFMNNSKR